VKPSSNEATEMPTRTYTTLEKRHILERENSYLENNQVSKWNGEGALELLHARHMNCWLSIWRLH